MSPTVTVGPSGGEMGSQGTVVQASLLASARDWYPVLGLGWLVTQIVGTLANLLPWGFGGPPSLVGIVASCLPVLVWIAAGRLLGRLRAWSFLLIVLGFWGLVLLSDLVAASSALVASVPLWLAQAVSIGLICPLHGFSLIPGGLTPLSLGLASLAWLAWLAGYVASRRTAVAGSGSPPTN